MCAKMGSRLDTEVGVRHSRSRRSVSGVCLAWPLALVMTFPAIARAQSGTAEITAELARETQSEKSSQGQGISSLNSTRDSNLAGVGARWMGARFGVNGRARVGDVVDPAHYDARDTEFAIRAELPSGLHVGYVRTAFRADVSEQLSATVLSTNVVRSSFQGPEIGVRSESTKGRLFYSVDFEGYPWLVERERHAFQLTGEAGREASRNGSAVGLNEEAAVGALLHPHARIEAFGRLRLIYSRRGDPLSDPEGVSHITVTYGARFTVLLGRR